MLAALALAGALAAQPTTLELSRGARVPASPELRYWTVADTTLDAREPNRARGGDYSLSGGTGRTILIQFQDLRRALGGPAKITSAELVLTTTAGSSPVLRSARRLLVPWGEGPAITTASRRTEGNRTAETPRGAATWIDRLANTDGSVWQIPGALGPSDGADIDGAKLELRDDQVIVTGLAGAVQNMLDAPLRSHGFALTFDSEVEFASSEAKEGRPLLRIAYEPVEKPSGPDLAVTLISRTPTQERTPSPAPHSTVDQDGVPVAVPGRARDVDVWPADGSEVEYRATVRNLGDQPSAAFTAVWSLNGRNRTPVTVDRKLAPGESTTISFRKAFQRDERDASLYRLSLQLNAAEDADPGNNGLLVYEMGVPVAIWVDKLDGAAELRAQAQIAALNVALERSRFSFLPGGALARVRLDAVVEGDAPAPGVDGIASLTDGTGISRETLRELALILGAPDLSATNGPASHVETEAVVRGQQDRFPGLTGGGDTRFEGTFPPQISLPYDGTWLGILEVNPAEPTDLLAATEAQAISQRWAKRLGPGGETLFDQPPTLILRATTVTGRPLANANLEFFQTRGGALDLATPTFTVKTGPSGTAILAARPLGGDRFPESAAGNILRAGPFGRLDALGKNGVFAVRATSFGVTEWAFLKAWQLTDSFHRGNRNAALVDLRFMLPTADLDPTGNLALGRGATDQADSLPSVLAPLTDGDLGTVTPLAEQPGAWVEIDLGRDRPVAEVRLVVAEGAMPTGFDVVLYSTGQRASESEPWLREADWPWTLRNRSDAEASGRSVAYRGEAIRARYVRIVNRTGGPGRLAEVRVIPAKASDQP